jgi:hypothetical protein
MGEIKRLIPKDGLTSEEFIKEFLSEWGGNLRGVAIIGMHKDGDIIDGWSTEAQKDAMAFLGAIEQLKMDFWYTLFEKRNEILGLE